MVFANLCRMADGIQKKIAVIVNTDDQPNTAEKHAQNVERAVAVLLAEDSSCEIHVLSPEKPKQDVDRYLEPSKENLKTLLEEVAGETDSDDLVSFYITGHGTLSPQGETALPIGQNEFYPVDTFYEQVDKITYGKRFIVMDTCLSGNIFSRFANDRTVIFTAGSPGEEVYCHTIAKYFWSQDTDLLDTNNDDLVTLQERFAYLMASSPEANQYQHPLFYGATLLPMALSGKEQVQGNFSMDVVEVKTSAELKRQLETLKPGELALVDFSADWCKPCHAYKPYFDDLAKNYRGLFKMIHVESINKSADDLFATYNISVMPAVGFMDHDGKLTLLDTEKNEHLTPINYVWRTTLTSEEQLAIYLKELKEVLGTQEEKAVLQKIGGLGKDGIAALDTFKAILITREIRPEIGYNPSYPSTEFSPPNQEWYISAIKNMGSEAIPLLLDWNPESFALGRTSAMQAIAYHVICREHRDTALPYLVTALEKAKNEQNIEKIKTILSLYTAASGSQISAARYLDNIVTFLAYPDPAVAKQACRGISRMGKKASRTLPQLEDLFLRTSDDSEILESILSAVADISTTQQLSAEVSARVGKLLNHPNTRVRTKAAEVLISYKIDHPDLKSTVLSLGNFNLVGRINLTKQEKAILINRLNPNDDSDASEEAAFILGLQGYKRVPEAFEPLLATLEQAENKQAYFEALGDYGGPRVLPILIKYYETRDRWSNDALRGIENMGEAAIPWCINEIKKSPKNDPPINCALVLIRIANELETVPVEITPALRLFLEKYEINGRWRQEIEHALSEIEDSIHIR